jgi:hypothetical protein
VSTRVVITVADPGGEEHSVYFHHDGYPAGVAPRLLAALDWAWALPRFEGTEFAAALVAASKPGPADRRGQCHQGGSVSLSPGPHHHGDLAYQYRVTAGAGPLLVSAFVRDRGADDGLRLLFQGDLAAFCVYAGVTVP